MANAPRLYILCYRQKYYQTSEVTKAKARPSMVKGYGSPGQKQTASGHIDLRKDMGPWRPIIVLTQQGPNY